MSRRPFCRCKQPLVYLPDVDASVCLHCDHAPHVPAHPSLPSCQACVVLGVVGTPERLP